MKLICVKLHRSGIWPASGGGGVAEGQSIEAVNQQGQGPHTATATGTANPAPGYKK